jgi:hypothetical protein
MGRPIKWSRDLYAIRERAQRSRTETWSRKDVEALFGVGRATAQTLTKAIGEIQNVAGAHFVERSSLLTFLDAMAAAPSIEDELNARIIAANAPPATKPLRIPLPPDLRSVLVRDLPTNITISSGRLLIVSDTAVGIVEGLALVAQALQNDLDQFQRLVEPPAQRSPEIDDELRDLFATVRDRN